ncbi:hypothetical protein SAMN05421783_10577 [Thiocapsa roseopersicina]|uniref:Uncharacterized protein n=1 Tax=Thiocapsa roseopersicina TaxID=1058 RepID=A0A1H2UEA1_THIRO|nr:hypothetical protein SAMN05421783_10577 [Thiocapsa roseopersicina]
MASRRTAAAADQRVREGVVFERGHRLRLRGAKEVLARKAAESRLSRPQKTVWSKRTVVKGLLESAGSRCFPA